MIEKYLKKLKHPWNLFFALGRHGLLNWMSDESYLKIAYRIKFQKPLDLSNVSTFNQKLQWLKLYDRKPIYIDLVNKLNVREFIKQKVGAEYLIPLYGVWDTFDEINFEMLPESFVLKTTHDSGGVVICKNKDTFNKEAAKSVLNKSLKTNYYDNGREWPYKDTERKIIAEKYMMDEKTNDLRDYKFFCFDGKVNALFVATNRQVDVRFDFFDPEFNHLPLKQYYPTADNYKSIEKPINFEKMKVIASKLSEGIPHVRVDLYEINGKIFFGELTLFHFNGWKKFEPDYYDELFGSWIELPNKIE